MTIMSDGFDDDVFLSHSAKDKAVVRPLAERLRKDGLRTNSQLSTLNSQPTAGLERSRVLVLCMSANAFGSDWAQLESGTFRFRDPLNKERRFVPLRLDNAPSKALWRNSLTSIGCRPLNETAKTGSLPTQEYSTHYPKSYAKKN